MESTMEMRSTKMLIDKRVDPLTHFFGRLVGKCNGQDIVWCDTFFNQVNNAVGNHASFSGASTS